MDTHRIDYTKVSKVVCRATIRGTHTAALDVKAYLEQHYGQPVELEAGSGYNDYILTIVKSPTLPRVQASAAWEVVKCFAKRCGATADHLKAEYFAGYPIRAYVD